jgi:hypothetical protein
LIQSHQSHLILSTLAHETPDFGDLANWLLIT